MKENIVVAGSIAYDRIINLKGVFHEKILPDKIDKLNVSFGVHSFHENFGGTGGNIAYNLSLLGIRPILLGCVGYDFANYRKWLKKNNIDISKIKVFSDTPTAIANVNTDMNNNQITFFFSGPSDTEYCDILRSVKNIKLMIVSPDYVPRMMKYIELCRILKIPYIFDPGQASGSISYNDLLWSIYFSKMLICNEYEAYVIMDKLKINFRNLVDMNNMLVVTKGAGGSDIFVKGKKYEVPCARVDCVRDPTGAGDAYRAGLIKSIVEGLDMETGGRFAGVVAAYAVEEYGSQNHRFDPEDIEKRFKKSY